MSKNELPQRKRLAAIFASFAIVLVGASSLMESMSLDYYSVLNTVEKVVPAAIVLGGVGWIMGMILDKPKKRRSNSAYNNLFLNDVIKKSRASASASEPTADTPVELPSEMPPGA